MKKIIICNIPMKEKTDKCAYTTDDLSLNISGREVIYPITAFLEKNLESTDEVKLLLLIKKDEAGHYQKNSADFIEDRDGSFFFAGVQMRVCIPCLLDLAVTEAAGDLLYIDSFVDK